MVLGLFVTRVVLHIIGRDVWGIWVASGALLSYAGLADLGVLGVLPWIIADADGRKDTDRIRAVLSHGAAFSLVAMCGFVCVASVLWHFYPSLLHLSESERIQLRGPLFAVVTLTAITFPLRTFSALLTGLQDAAFLGIIGLCQVLGTAALTLGLALSGFGLYALALGASLPAAAGAILSAVRAATFFRPLVRGWPRPTRALLRTLGVDGFGTWLGAIGFQLAASADPVILANIGLRDTIAGFAVTGRLPMTLTQFGWILPDAALVGLAQLAAEASRERVQEVVLAMLRLNLIVAGGVASAVLASNATFVHVWVGDDFFLGYRLNALLALNSILMTAVHGLASIACVFGKRMTVGLVFIGNGILHVIAASIAGRHIGVYGVSLATLVSGTLTALPVGLLLLEPNTGVTARRILSDVYWPWIRRFFPLAMLALLLGRAAAGLILPVVVAVCAAYGLLYIWWMRSLYVGLPLGPRITSWLQRARLLA